MIVTGGGKGIGEAIVRVLAAGSRCELVVHDLAEAGTCRAAVGDAVRLTGRIDALVSNAGVNDNVGVENGTGEEFMTSLRRRPGKVERRDTPLPREAFSRSPGNGRWISISTESA